MAKKITFLVFTCLSIISFSQIGGESVFTFLKFPVSARMEGMGGGLQSIQNDDLSLAFSNPSLIDSSLHKQIAFTGSFFPADIKYGDLIYAHYHKMIKTCLTYGVQYAAYGKFDMRDAAGNPMGTFKAADFNIQVGAARNFKNFHYGVNLKFILSHLDSYSSLAFAADVALGYHNPKTRWSATLILRNAGFQAKPYIKNEPREKLPLQLDLSFSKRFKHLPLTLSVTAHDLQVWNLRYPEEEQTNVIFGTTKKKKNTAIDNIFRHIDIGMEIEAGKPVRLRFGYNHLRRQELGTGTKKGFAGISAGFGLVIKQFAFDYAFAAYHRSGNDHQLSLRIKLDEFGHKAK